MNELTPVRGRQVASGQGQALNTRQYLTFLLAGETFGIGILCIKEIIEYTGLTEVPMMPPSIRGVINLRGAVVPVLDLAVRFGKVPSAVSKKTCVVIVEVLNEGARNIMGVVVDAVNAVQRIADTDIEPAPGFGAKIRTDFIEGMGKVHGKFVILLNVSQVLSAEELGALNQADEPLQIPGSPAAAALQ
jgi:purine-binding chemotaxis protein CheW